MFDPLQFGDIFHYSDKQYIFLAKIDEITYAAEILTKDHSKRLNDFCTLLLKNPRTIHRTETALFCFVILKTPQFKDRAAHFRTTGQDEWHYEFTKIGFNLNREDLIEIKNKILDDKTVIPKELTEYVKSLSI